MKTDGEYLTTEFTPQQWHEGWPGIVHGGIIAAVLYEVMENWPYLNGVTTMMRRMDTRLIAPAKVGETLRAVSWLSERDGRDLSVRGQLTRVGNTIAEGTASLVELSPEQRKRIGI
jgi:acyl-coenzyme A thioesterase PaaI-like protein